VNSWKVILATIVIFGAGVITGGLLVDHVQRQPHHHAGGPPAPPPGPSPLPNPFHPDVLNKQFVEQLDDKLDLSPDQKQKIQKIISQGQQNTRDLWKLVSPPFRNILQDTRQQIREVLTPDQRKEFEILMKQQRHPSSTNAPPVQLPPSTNTPPAPPIQPSAITNGPAV
jgi:hypothetical protein